MSKHQSGLNGIFNLKSDESHNGGPCFERMYLEYTTTTSASV